jgi:uncharacterized membrane protein
VLQRNVEALLERRRAEERARTRSERIAAAVSRFAGSMTFVALHALGFGAWLLANLPGSPVRFDPSLVKLATFASVEAIFLSTFVLVTQNRMSAQADRRADLDLQISLLAEHEVTRLIRLVRAVGEKLGVEATRADDLPELEQDVRPEAVLDRIEREGRTPATPPRAPPGDGGAPASRT